MKDNLPIVYPTPSNQPVSPSPGRVAGIDFGTVRIGIAICDSQRIIASPHETLHRASISQDSLYFKQLVEEERIVQFVIGLPVHTDGNESKKSLEAREFGNWLKSQTGVAVDYFDERFTTVMAEQQMTAAKLTKKKRKQRVDMIAAQLILSGYLESNSQANDQPGALDD